MDVGSAAFAEGGVTARGEIVNQRLVLRERRGRALAELEPAMSGEFGAGLPLVSLDQKEGQA